MSKFRFVEPEVVRYHLADGDDWVEIKRELTVGEREWLNGELFAGLKLEGAEPAALEQERELRLNWKRGRLARAEIYLVGWSFRDRNDKPVPVSPSSIASLQPDVFDELIELIVTHVQHQTDEKKVPALSSIGSVES